jgi:hypothetical protein
MTSALEFGYRTKPALAAAVRSGPWLPPTRLPRLLPEQGAVVVDLAEHVRRHGPVPYRGGPGRLPGCREESR